DALKLQEEILENIKSGTPFALATVVRGAEGAPGKAGFKMLIYPDGRSTGTVGGGAIEVRIVEEGKRCIESREARLIEVELKALGMMCGGSMAVFIEPLGIADSLYLFGAGHIGLAVAQMAQYLGFRIVVIDDRKELLTKEHFPMAGEIIASDMVKVAGSLEADPVNMYVVIATRGHALDQGVLEAFLKKPALPRYLGMIASRAKAKEILGGLSRAGISEERLTQVKTPIGISIGAKTPSEIAVSILAEVIAVKHSG
ncbi:xanthine dehydrogenase accessory factor, partial [Candidatus Hakubella thermalkaliphila]